MNYEQFGKVKAWLSSFATEKTLLALLLVVSASLNIFLAIKFVQSRNQVELLRDNRKLTVGEIAPLLKANDETGQEVIIHLPGREFPTVLYLQSATCYWCEQNIGSLQELALQSHGKYHLIALSMEPAAKVPARLVYSNVQNLFEPSVESKISFDLSATPTTIIFSPEGRVQKIWKGAYNDERTIEIEKFLGVRVPAVGQ